MQEFSANEAIELAIQIEREGHDFFGAVAANATNEEVKTLFEWLASEELRHMAVFESFRGDEEKVELAGPYNWEEVAAYLRSLVQERIFPSLDEGRKLAKDLRDLPQVFHFAIQLEKENILYFHELRELVSEKTRPMIGRLIEEEKQHIRRLVDLRARMGAAQ